MENLFSRLTEVITGIVPMLTLLVNWLMNDGLIFGLLVIVFPLLGKVINILSKLRR